MSKDKTNTNTSSKEERQKSYALLIFSAILILLSLIFTIYAYNTSYQQSLAVDKELKDLKLSLQRPYSYGLTVVFLSAALLIKGIYNATIGTVIRKADIKKLALAGLMAALCYIGFALFKIDIPVGTEKTAFHFGNVFCVLAALLIGGYWGGLAGAIGMTIGDLTTAYVTSAPKTFFLKLCIGLITGLVAHTLLKVTRDHSQKYVIGATIAATTCGMLFNVFADPLTGYFYKMYLLGIPQEIASVFAKWSAVTTFVNAIIAVIFSTIFYLALRPALKKSGLFIELSAKNKND